MNQELILRADKYEELYKISRCLLAELNELYDEVKQKDLYVEDLISRAKTLIQECEHDNTTKDSNSEFNQYYNWVVNDLLGLNKRT